MAFIGKDILKRTTLKRQPLQVDEWDGQIFIRELTGKEAQPITQLAGEINADRLKNTADAEKVMRWQALTVCYGWINEDGSHVLNPEDADQLLATQPYALLERIATEIRVLSGLQKRPEAKDSATDEAKKNLTETQSEGSGSA